MKNRLILKYPASWWGAKWREALPAGNGTLGAAVYGAVHQETVLLTHEELWRGVSTPEMPDISAKLPEVRNLLFADRAPEADRVFADEFERLGYNPHVGVPTPVGDLKIKMPVCEGFRNYRRELDMETGEVSVCWNDGNSAFCRKLFVSRTDEMIVMQIERRGTGTLSADIALDLHDRNDVKAFRSAPATLPENPEVSVDGDGFIFYAATNDDGLDFGAVARVITSGALTPKDGAVSIDGSNDALILVKLFVKEPRATAWSRLKAELNGSCSDYNCLFARHAAEHRELFNRVKLDINVPPAEHQLSNEELLLAAYQGEAPAALVEKMWAYGRYLLISSSRAGGLPCPLLGKWCGEYRGFWAFNMANENLQMIYWQATSGQLPETLTPVFDYFDNRMDDFRENARKLFGCRGIYIPGVTTPPSGLLKTIRPHVIYWTGAAAWVGQHYYDYYLYTGDEQFLRERALPFLREAALFYEDFFITGADGFYISAPSNSPENNPANYWDGNGMTCAMETTINATMDFALAKEVLTHLIEGSKTTGVYADDIPRYEKMLSRIPPYQINDDGAIKEWMHPFFIDNYHHRHQSHIYPLFPGVEVTHDSDPHLFAAFETAIQKRLAIGISEQTGWSLAHMANVFARMHKGDRALNCLNLVARSCLKNNFYSTHNDWRDMGIGVDMDWAPFQIDANMGWTAAVQEMLLFSIPGRISILPALPEKWSSGSVSGLAARGGVTVSISWNAAETTVHVVLCSPQKDQSVELDFPFGLPRQTIALKAGVPQSLLISKNKEAVPA